MNNIASEYYSAPSPEQASRSRRLANPLPYEGQDGLFFQTWYPICLSSEIPAGTILGCDFLDGKVVAYRTESGRAHVVSAYCPHIGADLSVGSVIGDNLRCAFHHWEYDETGVCTKTGIGDTPPKAACLFHFPTLEKYGVIWAFNGDAPHWKMPDFEIPHEDLHFRVIRVPHIYNCDGWIFCCNTPDMQHIKVVHKIKFTHDDPHTLVEWLPDGFDYRFTADHQGAISINWQIGIRGTSFFRLQGTYDGWWLGSITGHSCPRPNQHEVFLILAVERGDGSPEAMIEAEKRLDIAQALLERTVDEDRDILNTIHYQAGTLTKGDRTLSQFFDYLRAYPRAHPSAQYIR